MRNLELPMAAFQGHDTTGDEPFAPGDRVYAEDGDGWRLATVQSLAGHSITLDDGSECAIDELLRCNDADADDVSTLQQIHEPAVLKCLEGRDCAFCGPNVILARGHALPEDGRPASNPHPEPTSTRWPSARSRRGARRKSSSRRAAPARAARAPAAPSRPT